MASANAVWTVLGLATGFAGAVVGLAARAVGGAGDRANAIVALAAAAVYLVAARVAVRFPGALLGPDSTVRERVATRQVLALTRQALADAGGYLRRHRGAAAAAGYAVASRARPAAAT